MAITYATSNRITADGNYHIRAERGRSYILGITGTWDSAHVYVSWQDSANESLADFPDLPDAPNPLSTNGGMRVESPGDCISLLINDAGENTDLVYHLTPVP